MQFNQGRNKKKKFPISIDIKENSARNHRLPLRNYKRTLLYIGL